MTQNDAPKLPRLKPGQRRLLGAISVLSIYVFANSLYLQANRLDDCMEWNLLALSDIAMPPFHQAMILSHTAVGVLLAGIFAGFAVSHLRDMWSSKRKAAVWSGVATLALGGGLSVTGMFILTEANSAENSWAWWTHVGLAVLVPSLYVAHRLVSRSPIAWGRFMAVGAAPIGVLCGAMLVAHYGSDRGLQYSAEAADARARGMHTGPGSRDFDRGLRLEGEFRPEIDVKPGSPFYPSSATTTSGDWMPSRIVTRDGGTDRPQMDEDLDEIGFVANVLVGAESCARCHADTTAQWASSAHRFSSFNNPWYEATINDMRETANSPNPGVLAHVAQHEELADKLGVVKSNWCSGCHDPAVMMAGKMNKPIDRRSAEAQAGLACLACHAIDKIHGLGGNAGYNIADEQEDPYLFANAKSGLLSFVHDAALQAKPTVHKRQMLKEFHGTSEFCSTCHKVSLDEPVNSYRWIRGQNDYDGWHDSGVSRNAARTFYLPPNVRKCQDCHMPMVDAPLGDLAATDGKVRDHRFAAANTALPFLRGDQAMIDATEKMLREAMRIEIFAARGENPEDEFFMSLAGAPLKVPVGRDAAFHVVVRNKGVGHGFPGGTIDSNEGWIELSLEGPDGEKHVLSGFVGDDLHVDKDAHFYRGVIIAEDSQKITRRNAQDIRVPVYANIVGPGTADLARYKIRLPEAWAGEKAKLTARLLWRKFDQRYNEFAFKKNPAGFAQFDAPPALPITEMAKDEVAIQAIASDGKLEPASKPTLDPAKDWVRFNDYGIALILDGDTVGASRAFDAVRRLDPKRRDGYVNLARVALLDGNLDAAFKQLDEAEKIEPGNALTAYHWGNALMEDGDYARAINAYRRTLETFPNDRDTVARLGRAYYLNKQHKECLETMDRALKIDPEHRVAHYHRMLALRALGDAEGAKIAEKAYAKYNIDESAREWVRKYALENPEDQLHSQPIFTHDLTAWRPGAQRPYAPPANAPSGPVILRTMDGSIVSAPEPAPKPVAATTGQMVDR